MIDKNLTKRSLKSVYWILSGTGIKILLQIVQTVVLSRLLTPEDFGLMGIAFIVVRFVELSPIGIGPTLVQLPTLETKHMRAGFTISALIGLVLGVIIWLTTPMLANFFHNQELVPILHIIALTFPLSNLSVVSDALLQRELKFKSISTIEVSSFILGYAIVGIILAHMNFGVWSLVSAYVVQTLTQTILLLLVQPHPKQPLFEQEIAKELLSIGSGFTLVNVLSYFALQGDYIVVGKFMGSEPLGLYTRAYRLMALPTNTIGQAMNRVLFPALAKVQDDRHRLQKAYKRNLNLLLLISLPITVVMYILAPEIIIVLLSSRWREAIIPFQVLALGTFFRLAHKVSSTVARSSGQIYRLAWVQGIYAGLVVGGAWFGLRFGLQGVAIGITLALCIQYLLLSQLAVAITEIKPREFFECHLSALPLAVTTFTAVWGSANLLRMYNFPSFIVLGVSLIITGICLFIAIIVAPGLFLGKDGSWWSATILKSISTSSLVRKLLKK